MNERIKRQIRLVSYTLISMITLLFVYLAYIQVVRHDFWLTHSLNKRTLLASRQIERGKILDRNGTVLAHSIPDKNGYQRVYPFEGVFAPLVGYDSIKYGRAGLEASYNAELAGYRNAERQLGPISRMLQAKAGNSLVLTLDAALQQQAFKELGNRRGAIVVLDVKTGALLACVSKPSFSPNAIDKEWNTIVNAENSPLLNRAVAGLYPPGSIVKVMVADAALNSNLANKQYQCEGQLQIAKDYTLHEAGNTAHGRLNLGQALAVSCNVTFGSIAIELGRSQMADTFERFGFKLNAEYLGEQPSRLPNFTQLGNGDLAQSGIGQSSILTTPLKMATVAAAFANRGVIMKPFIVDKVLSPESVELYKANPSEWIKATSPDKAAKIASMMKAVVDSGTGRRANAYSVTVAGKTGTAENPHGDSHAWFIGFAPAVQPQVAIAVIIENSGSGGSVAAPLAGKILAQAVH